MSTTKETPMKLYFHPASTTCRPILLLAAEAAIPLQMQVVDLFAGEHRTERFAAINPNRAVPVLEDGSFRLTESSAILKYLAEVRGAPSYPSDPRARARVNALMDWFNTGFYREFGYGVVYPQVIPDYAWPNAAMGSLALIKAEHGARRHLDVLDRHWLAGAGPYLGGAEPCLADYMGAAYVTIGELAEFDLSPWPRIRRWIAAMKARPSWSQVNGAFEDWRKAAHAARALPAAAA
jgi:glutathione S-transferase